MIFIEIRGIRDVILIIEKREIISIDLIALTDRMIIGLDKMNITTTPINTGENQIGILLRG